MRIKTFYTKTMSEALREIKASLGPDALLLSTKEIPRRAGGWGRSSGFEVVAAIDQSESVDVFSSSGEEKAGNEKAYSPELDALETSLHEAIPETYSPGMLARNAFRASVKGARVRQRKLCTLMGNESEVLLEKELPFKGHIALGLYQDLIHCGVDKALAKELLSSALDSLPSGQRRSRAVLERLLGQAALNLVSIPSYQNEMPEKRVIAFVGPTGVGKSTSIAKLAARLALQKKQKVVLMTLDGNRIGSVEQMRSYAGLMGMPFRFVDEVSGLPRAIEENNQRDYILIDTAGRSPKDMTGMHSLADYLKKSDFIERHLVLSATTKPSDMRNFMDQYEICNPDHLLFTKLDETSTPGPILNELVRTQKRFSYYTDGQRVPDDLHLVPREGLMDIVLHRDDNAIKDNL